MEKALIYMYINTTKNKTGIGGRGRGEGVEAHVRLVNTNILASRKNIYTFADL